MLAPYLDSLRRYADFDGRSGRREFWMTWRVHAILIAILIAIDLVVIIPALADGRSQRATWVADLEWPISVTTLPWLMLYVYQPVLTTLYLFATLLPIMGLGVRRLRDYGYSGWWQLLWVSWIFWVPLLASASTQGARDSDRDDAWTSYRLPQDSEPRRNSFVAAWVNALEFNGYANRAEYWPFPMITIGAVGVLVLITALAAAGGADALAGLFGFLALTWWVSAILPGTALAVRRLRDAFGSGWLVLLVLIPFFGAVIVYLILPIFPTRLAPVPQAKGGHSHTGAGNAVDRPRPRRWRDDDAVGGNDPWDRR